MSRVCGRGHPLKRGLILGVRGLRSGLSVLSLMEGTTYLLET